MSGQQFAQAIATLRSAVGLKTDFTRCLIWVPSALEHMGPPANPNIVRSYCRGLQLAPKSELREEAIRSYAPFLAHLGQHFLKPFADCFPMVCQTVLKPLRKEIEIEIEREKETGAEIGGFASGGAETLQSGNKYHSSSISGKIDPYETGLRHVADILKSLE